MRMRSIYEMQREGQTSPFQDIRNANDEAQRKNQNQRRQVIDLPSRKNEFLTKTSSRGKSGATVTSIETTFNREMHPNQSLPSRKGQLGRGDILPTNTNSQIGGKL
ncbi:hypothetical protein V6N13_097770 [Hibiscus sabdariffa]|uniref:Uncharacterized protein n=2 Tax=Hibiscus sabdariffa TaxID=183260 RepID=A0ABR1ZVE6_9ROSI